MPALASTAGEPRQSPQDSLFSPRSTAAMALSSFSQQQQMQHQMQQHDYEQQQQQMQLQYWRDFSPPAAFDPPRATLRASAKKQVTEIQPRGSNAAPAAQHQHQHQHLVQGQNPPPFPPYYGAPHWEQHPLRQRQQHLFPMPPMPANAWQHQPPSQHQQQPLSQQLAAAGVPVPAGDAADQQQHASQLSSTSMLPDPRVSAISAQFPPPPHLPPGSKPRVALAPYPAFQQQQQQHPSMMSSHMGSNPLQPMVRKQRYRSRTGPNPTRATLDPNSHTPVLLPRILSMAPRARDQSQNPYYSQTRSRPPPHTFVTPTPKKLRMSDPASAGAPAAASMMMGAPRAGAAASAAAAPTAASSLSSSSSYSRKTKSLGVLAENFCQIFAARPPYTEIIIDSISTDLGVERRRIYDVVNILESIRVVVKKAKNTYCWMGSGHLPCMFALLQREAFDIYPDDAVRNGLIKAHPSRQQSNSGRSKDTRSLSRLSQHFLEVYLAGNVEVSLPDASDKIHGETTVNQLAALGSRGREPVDVFDAKKFQQAAAS
jgi:E2F/DP family winged-helix DNA-binding domain